MFKILQQILTLRVSYHFQNYRKLYHQYLSRRFKEIIRNLLIFSYLITTSKLSTGSESYGLIIVFQSNGLIIFSQEKKNFFPKKFFFSSEKNSPTKKFLLEFLDWLSDWKFSCFMLILFTRIRKVHKTSTNHNALNFNQIFNTLLTSISMSVKASNRLQPFAPTLSHSPHINSSTWTRRHNNSRVRRTTTEYTPLLHILKGRIRLLTISRADFNTLVAESPSDIP